MKKTRRQYGHEAEWKRPAHGQVRVYVWGVAGAICALGHLSSQSSLSPLPAITCILLLSFPMEGLRTSWERCDSYICFPASRFSVQF